ncbi:MAG: hypothetical protein OQK12_09870 [Motiliproteus sp.]|nr:hypothetical protein [Motiliproteus sp.]MCW9051266.1 hypothetical protein [Motiliproteus sp.]
MDMVHRMNELDRRRTTQRTPTEVTESAMQIIGKTLVYIAGSLVIWAACFGVGTLLGLLAPEEHIASGNRGSHLSDGLPDAHLQYPVSDTAAETVHLLVARNSTRAM